MNTAIAAAAALFTLSADAQASQITLGNSTVGTFDFAGVPPASVTVASPGIAGTGTAFFEADGGSYSFGAVAPFAAGPLIGGNFPTAGAQNLSVALGDGDALTGTITWSLLKDHSMHPDLDGALAITTSFGDAAWLASFPAGGTADIDLALTLFPGALLDDLAAEGGGQWATVSSGEIVPRAVDEPTTVMLLGAALVGFFWLRGKLA